MKQNKQWFKLLTEKQQAEFKENCWDRFDKYMERSSDNWMSFISNFPFNWKESPQGFGYWLNITNNEPKQTTLPLNFWSRLQSFVSDIQVNDMAGEEEKEMIINVCNKQLNDKE